MSLMTVGVHYAYAIVRNGDGYLIMEKCSDDTTYNLTAAEYCKDFKEISNYFLYLGVKDRILSPCEPEVPVN